MEKKGFTLIELIVVIAIIAILSVVVMNTVMGSIGRANAKLDDTNQQLLKSSAQAYCELHKDDDPVNTNIKSGSVKYSTLVAEKLIPSGLKADDNTPIGNATYVPITVDSSTRACTAGTPVLK